MFKNLLQVYKTWIDLWKILTGFKLHRHVFNLYLVF